MDENQREQSGTASKLFRALAGVLIVTGSTLGAFYVVASVMMFHGDNTVPLLCALTSGVLAGLAAIYCVKRLFR